METMNDPYVVIEWEEKCSYTTRVRLSQLANAMGENADGEPFDISDIEPGETSDQVDSFLADRVEEDFDSCDDRRINEVWIDE